MNRNILSAGVASLIIVAGALSAYYFSGNIAETALEKYHQRLANALPGYEIVDRQYQRGFFSSTETARLRVAKSIRDKLGEQRKAAEASAIIITSHIRHGPILGTHGIGAAWIEAEFEYPEELKELVHGVFGDKPPLAVAAKLDFDRSIHIVIDSPPTQARKSLQGELKWGGAHLELDLSHDVENISYKLSVPSLSFSDAKKQPGIKKENTFTNITSSGQFRQFAQEQFSTYFGNAEIKFGKIAVIDASEDKDFSASNLAFSLEMPSDGDFVAINMKLLADNLRPDSDGLFTLGKFDLSIGFRHLHALSIAELSSVVSLDPEAYQQPANAALIEKAVAVLFRNHPEVSVDRLVANTLFGPVDLTAKVTFDIPEDEPITAATLPNILREKVHVLGKASLPAVPQADGFFADYVNKSYLTREGNRLNAGFEFKNGKVMLNGHPLQ